eukprot:5803459-Amphidinium_carterae.1
MSCQFCSCLKLKILVVSSKSVPVFRSSKSALASCESSCVLCTATLRNAIHAVTEDIVTRHR